MGLAGLVDHSKLIEGPSNLVPVQGKFLSGTCKTFRAVTTSQGGSGSLLANPDLRYSYQVSDRAYEGTRYARSKRYAMGNPDECERYLSSMRAHPEVTVWIDPANPEFSVLSKDIPAPLFEYVFMSIGMALMVVGGYFIYSRRLDEA